MKQIALFVFSILISQCSLFAQKEIVSISAGLIKQHKYQQANHFLDSVLRKNPNSFDAWRMKGNVVLSCAYDSTKPMQFVSNDDVSVFTTTISDKPKLLPSKTANQVAKIWQNCFRIDATRAGIRKDLCMVYATALMKDSLEKEMLRLMQTEPDDGGQAFRLGEYARKFKERNRFDEAMELYEFIAQQFPNVAGIRGDIASEYFYAGMQKETLAWLDSTFRFKKLDETSFLSGAFLYSELGYFGDAQSVMNTYAGIFNKKTDMCYYGLTLFADSSEKCYDVFSAFLQAIDTGSYPTETHVAGRLLQCRDSFTLENYRLLVADNAIPDYYKVLIHARAIRQFANNCEPFIVYGIFQAYMKNYHSAAQFLEEGENCEVAGDIKEYWQLVYAYALFKSDPVKSIAWFSRLYNSGNAFYNHASKYFIAICLLDHGKNEDAENLLKELAISSTSSKYAELARIRLNSSPGW